MRMNANLTKKNTSVYDNLYLLSYLKCTHTCSMCQIPCRKCIAFVQLFLMFFLQNAIIYFWIPGVKSIFQKCVLALETEFLCYNVSQNHIWCYCHQMPDLFQSQFFLFSWSTLYIIILFARKKTQIAYSIPLWPFD